jgi:Tfp pilus assembly protein PilX
MRRLQVRCDSEAGFGLISVLVAMVLLAVGVVALSSSSAFLVSMQTDTSVRTTATSIGIAYMEDVKKRPPRTLASEEPERVNELGEADEGGVFIRSLTVGVDAVAPDVVQVGVEVRYPNGPGSTGRINLATIIYRGNE